MIYSQTTIQPRERDTQNSLGFWNTNRSPNPGQTTRPCDSQQKKKEKKNLSISKLCHRVKIKENEKKKKEKYLDLARELKNANEYESNSDTNCNWWTWNAPERLSEGAVRDGNRWAIRNHPGNRIVDIGQNTDKSPIDSRRLAVNQTPNERPSANPGVKTPQMSNIIIRQVKWLFY